MTKQLTLAWVPRLRVYLRDALETKKALEPRSI